MNKISVIGFTSSGKTSYLVGMYNALCNGISGFSVVENDMDVDLYLDKVWKNLCENGEFPFPSDSKETYHFSLLQSQKKIRTFEWLDYPGSVLSDGGDMLRDLSEQLAESSCLLLLVNGASFAFQGDPDNQERIQAASVTDYKQIVSNNLRNNKDLQAIRQLNRLGAQGVELPPIVIVLTKSDLIEDKWALYAKDILRDNFSVIFGAPGVTTDRIVMITHTSLGDLDPQNGFRVDPINVELPIAFGVLSILRDDVIKYKLLHANNQTQINTHQKNKFTRWLNSDTLNALKKENDKCMADIKAASKDIFKLLDLFDDDKNIYINNVEKNLKVFFRDELK